MKRALVYKKIRKPIKKIQRNPLTRAMIMVCVLFSILSAIIMGAIGFFVYEHDMLHRYHAYTADVLNYVARSIDGDDLQQCMQTGAKSEKYNALQTLTNDLKETHKLEFLYIIQPISENPPDNMMDVLAAYTQAGKEAGTDGLTDLGNYTADFYPPEVARQYIARMDYDPTVTFFQNDTEFGNIYTAIRPIFNSSGEPIAVLCADVLIDEIDAGRIRFIALSSIMAMLTGIILSIGMSYWLIRRVAGPIQRISSSASAFAKKSHGRRDLEVMSFNDPNIHTHDEIEDLAKALASMCDDMKAYVKELITADRRVGTLEAKVIRMDHLAYTDALTGAGNKAAYEKYTASLNGDIQAGKAKFAMIMVDLNYLKRINDTYGHDQGNQYIKNLYTLLWHYFNADMIFRIGGDEFVVLLQGNRTDRVFELVKSVKRDMALTMSNPNTGSAYRISAAIGIAVYSPVRHANVNDVFKEADRNMYMDKNAMHTLRD